MQDDLLLPEKIERQVRQLESNPSPAISACDYRYFDGRAIDQWYGGDVFKGQFPFENCEQLFSFETVIHRWLIRRLCSSKPADLTKLLM
jgi:hypothetical protein